MMTENVEKQSEGKSIDDALTSVREAIVGIDAEQPTHASNINDAENTLTNENAGKQADDIIELTAMIRPPKGYKSVKDYDKKMQSAKPQQKAEEDVQEKVATAESEPIFKVAEDAPSPNNMATNMANYVDESLSVSLLGNTELQAELHEAIRPILQKWLAKNLNVIVNDVLEDELKHCLDVLNSKKQSGRE